MFLKVKKNIFFLSLAFGFSISLKGQTRIGLEAGIDNNYLNTRISNVSFTGYHTRQGITIGIPVEFGISDWFAVGTGIIYLQKNYQWYRTDYYAGEYEDFRNSYLQIPLAGKFSFGTKKIRGFLEVGGFMAFWTGGHVQGVAANIFNPVYPPLNTPPQTYLQVDSGYQFNEAYAFDNRRDNRVEFGWMAGCGVEYLLSKYILFIKGRLFQSLTDQQKEYMINQTPRYNITESLVAGVSMTLH
jgi:Outer membrane protein beta-barrel domain